MGGKWSLKEAASYLRRASTCVNPPWHTSELWGLKYCIVLSSGLPGVLPSATNKGSKKGFKTPWGREISLLKTQMGFWCIARCAGEDAQSWCSCSEPRAGTQLFPQMPGRHHSPSSRGEPEEGIGRATGLGRAKGTSHLEKRFCMHEPRLSLKLFLGCPLASLPSAPNQK